MGWRVWWELGGGGVGWGVSGYGALGAQIKHASPDTEEDRAGEGTEGSVGRDGMGKGLLYRAILWEEAPDSVLLSLCKKFPGRGHPGRPRPPAKPSCQVGGGALKATPTTQIMPAGLGRCPVRPRPPTKARPGARCLIRPRPLT